MQHFKDSKIVTIALVLLSFNALASASAFADSFEVRFASKGLVGPPAFTLESTPGAVLTFPGAGLGATAEPSFVFGFKNTGRIAATLPPPVLEGVNAADFDTASSCNNVPANQRCSVTVSFIPTDLGLRTTTLLLNNKSYSLSGEGTGAPTISLVGSMAATQSFNSATVGMKSDTSIVWSFKNTGTGPGALPAPAISGAHAADFTVTADPNCSNLGVGQTCAVTAFFTPSATGPRSGTLALNGANYSLQGEGGLGAMAGADSNPIVYCSVNTTCYLNVNLKNIGSARTRVASYSINQGELWWTIRATGLVDNDCRSVDVAPNATCVLPLAFRSGATGSTGVDITSTTTSGISNGLGSGNGWTAKSQQ